MWNIVALTASVAILTAYVVSARKQNPRTLHWANAVLWPAVAAPTILAGVWGAAFITIGFGAIGTYGLFKDRQND